VRSFGTFTGDLHRLADWFQQCGVRTVAMESTGVYWIPAFEILDQRGFEVILVNARDAKHVPGRKTDISDAQWLQRLHEYGLLRASFRLKGEVAVLRGYLRQRERLLDYAGSHIQHMQKALTQMNLQLHHVVTDITGTTGMAIIRAIVAGERDPAVLAAHRHPRCHASTETIRQALVGNDREEHIFALTQALELYDVYQAKVALCDVRIEAVLKRLRKASSSPAGKPPPVRTPKKQANAMAFDVRAALHGLLGCDVTQIHGLGPYLALKLVGECGTNLSAWPNAKHFTSNSPGARHRRRSRPARASIRESSPSTRWKQGHCFQPTSPTARNAPRLLPASAASQECLADGRSPPRSLGMAHPLPRQRGTLPPRTPFEGETINPRRIQTMNRGPEVLPVADIGGHALFTSHSGEHRHETVRFALSMHGTRIAHHTRVQAPLGDRERCLL